MTIPGNPDVNMQLVRECNIVEWFLLVFPDGIENPDATFVLTTPLTIDQCRALKKALRLGLAEMGKML